MSKSTLKILPALMAAITAALVTQSVYGGSVTDHQLVFTENSSTSLTATFDGAPLAVFFVANDSWIVTTPNTTLPSTVFGAWFEPGSTTSINEALQFPSPTSVLVDSEIPLGFGLSPEPNGFTFVDAGTLTSDGVGIDVTFHDNGDTARTPDTGTTGSLLGLSLMGLAFLRRKLC